MVGIIIILLLVVLFILKKKIQRLDIESLEEVFEAEGQRLFLLTTIYSMAKIHLGVNEENFLNGSFSTDTKCIKKAKQSIGNGYGIEDKQSAIETLEWLKNEGQSLSYQNSIELLNEDDSELKEYEKDLLEEINSKYKEKLLFGWDYVRGNQVALYSYMCGYLNEDELLKYCTDFSNAIHYIFDDWNDLVENVALGHKFLACYIIELEEEHCNNMYQLHMETLNNSNIYKTVSWN